MFLEFGFEGEAEGVEVAAVGGAVFLEFGFEGEAQGVEVVGVGTAVFLELGFEGEAVGFEVLAGRVAVGCKVLGGRDAEGVEVLGGGQVAVKQAHLFVGQGFGLFGGEAAFDEVLDEPVGVEGSCGSHRGIVGLDGGGCNRYSGVRRGNFCKSSPVPPQNFWVWGVCKGWGNPIGFPSLLWFAGGYFPYTTAEVPPSMLTAMPVR